MTQVNMAAVCSCNCGATAEKVTSMAVVVTRIPSGWQPDSWHSIPPGLSGRGIYVVSMLQARLMNEQRILRRNRTGKAIESWAVAAAGKNPRVVILNGLVGFNPETATDMPVDAVQIEQNETRKPVEIVEQLNRTLINVGRWAFVAHVPETIDEIERLAQRYAAQVVESHKISTAMNNATKQRATDKPPKIGPSGVPETVEAVAV